MAKTRPDVLQGTLTLLVLKTLSHGRLHGYAISSHIEGVSRKRLRVETGSLYPALRRMEQEGWITAEWSLTETNRRARAYGLTVYGRRQLAREEEKWNRIVGGVGAVLRYRSGAPAHVSSGAW